jgi:protein-S-isoprenylcysteine O-methyltransferase Ste14
MFEQWGIEEWIMLPFLLVAVVIIIWFLRKFDEIELRQQFEARRKRQQRLLLESE